MFSRTLNCDEQNETLRQTSDEAFAGLVAIIRNGQAAGLYRDSDPAVLALSAWSLVHGYAMLASTGRLDPVAATREAKLELARQVESLLIDGLVNR